MSLALLFFLAEYYICGMILSPNASTDTSIATIIMFAINLIITIFAVSSSIKSNENKEEAQIKQMVLASLVIRIAILLWDVYARDILILPNSEGDAEWYHKIGISYAFEGRANEVDFNKYSFYIGQIYKVIGVQKLTVQYLNVFFAIWSIILVYRIICKFNVEYSIRKKAMFFACFLPNLMMITTFFLQESIISFFIVLSIYFYSKWWVERKLIFVLFSLLSSIAGAFLHLGGIVVALGIMALMFVVGWKDRSLKFSPLRIGSIVIMIFVGIIILSTFGDTFLGKLGGEITAESVMDTSKVKAYGGGSYTIGITGLPPMLDLIINTPIRMFYFIFSPLPWTWRGLSDIIAFFGSTVFYIYAVVQIVKSYRFHPLKNLRDDNISSFMFVLTIIILVALIMFGWGVSNSGSVLRHREKFTFLFILLYAISEETKLRVWEKNSSVRKEQESIGDSSSIQCERLSAKMR